MRYAKYMSQNDEKTLRQLSLLSFLLDARRPVSPHEIMQTVEGYAGLTPVAFKKRFFEDRQELKELGIKIERTTDPSTGEQEAYHLPRSNYQLPEIFLSPDEIATLYATVLVLGDRFPLSRPLRLAIAALNSFENPHAAPVPLPHTPNIIISHSFDDDPTISERLARATRALRARKTISFEYQGVRSEKAENRTVDPYGIYLIAGHWYLVGRDHARDAIRMFRFDRITGPIVQVTRKVHDYSIPPDYDPDFYRLRPPWLLSDATGTAEVLVSQDLTWWVDRIFGRFAESRKPCGSDVCYTFAVSDPDALLAWVVTHRRHIRLLGPRSLVDRLITGLERVANIHKARTTRAGQVAGEEVQ